ISSLDSKDRIVSIIIDEVYSSQRVEFVGGKLYGYVDNVPTKTVLCFMIKSVLGRYNDVVAMVPLSKIDSKIMEQWFFKVLKLVTEVGFRAVAILTDGHSVNNKFFRDELGNGSIPLYIENPFSIIKEKMSSRTKDGLSSETFLAAIQTSRGLAELSKYLLNEGQVKYILLRKINSDPLEKRFGWYRQLGGGNYFLNCRQFLESEKKIRINSLLMTNIQSFLHFGIL
ncbi:Putative LOC101234274, partial [Caligus rogercresseyi]